MAHSKQYVRLMNSADWSRTRREQLSRHPLCERCQSEGRVRAAQCVHHIIPIESVGTDAEMRRLCHSDGNLMSLCFECHAKEHEALRSHSRDTHKERNRTRLEAWAARHFGDGS